MKNKDRVIREIVFWANMRLPVVQRTLEGYITMYAALRKAVEWDFYNEEYQRIREQFKTVEQRLDLAKNTLDVVVQPYKAKMEDFKKQAIAAGISPDQAKFFLNNDVKILNKLITVLSSFEEDKDINSKHKNLDSDQELNAIEKTNIKEFLDIYKGMGDIEREYLLVNILKPYLSDLKRIQSLERVVERRGWLPIITLTRDEQNKIWNVPHNAAFGKADPASTSDIKEFLKFDLYYDRLVGKKFNVYTVYKNFGPGAALAEEYN